MSKADLARRAHNGISPHLTPHNGVEVADVSYLTYMIPAQTNIDLDTAFENAESGKPILDCIKQRKILFFDETVDILLVLKLPWLEENALQDQLNRLVISVEGQIAGSGPTPGRDSPQTSESFFSGKVPNVSDPFIVVDEERDDAAADLNADDPQAFVQRIYAIWKMPIFMSRPRSRIQSPRVIFNASASLRPEVSAEVNSAKKGFLPSGVPSGLNLLESFTYDPALKGVKPRLSALRVSRVAPVTPQQQLMTHLRALSHLRLKIKPLIHTRLKVARPTTAPATSSVVAMLEVDLAPHTECPVSLDEIKLSIDNATITNLSESSGMQLPLACVAHDHITFLYHITPDVPLATGKPPAHELSISISAVAHIVAYSCMPRLSLTWTTPVDLTAPVAINPGFTPAAVPAGPGLQRAHRPSQLSIGGGQAVTPLKSPSDIRPDALPVLEAATTRAETTVAELGITLSVQAPSIPIRPGEIFSWSITIVNRSSSQDLRSARKLALIAIPKRRRNEVRHTRPPSTASRRQGEKEVAGAVVDDNILHAMQKSATIETAEIVCLSADTRIGPLAPGACHVVEMQFMALQEGIVSVEAIRIIDLASQEHVDIKDLPTIVVESTAG